VVLTEAPPARRRAPGTLHWADLLAAPGAPGHRVIDTDIAAILYTSGSTGRPRAWC
jgi:acyl-coenzyme A synthetase/AMP-(fatty) acid ligase